MAYTEFKPQECSDKKGLGYRILKCNTVNCIERNAISNTEELTITIDGKIFTIRGDSEFMKDLGVTLDDIEKTMVLFMRQYANLFYLLFAHAYTDKALGSYLFVSNNTDEILEEKEKILSLGYTTAPLTKD